MMQMMKTEQMYIPLVGTKKESNHRTVNRAMLALLADTSTELDGATISALEDVAYQCPLQGGNAVYRARAFLRMFGEYSFHKVDCEEQALRRGVQSAAAELRAETKPSDRDGIADWRVYPNPTSQTLFISGGDATLLRSIRMTDLFDRVIGQWPSGTTVLHLDTNLPDGVYFLHFHEADGTTVTRKVIVAK